MFEMRCEYSKHVANVLNTLQIFETHCWHSKRIANIQTSLRFKDAANNENTLLMFQTRY